METVFSVSLPVWLQDLLQSFQPSFPSAEAKMKWVIGLSRMNIEHGTGGPFAAAVFEQNSGRLISAGVNLVASCGLSIAHAEITALSLAQKTVGKHRLSCPSGGRYELYSSCQPCAMCLGAIPWSGISYVVCAAREEDARRAGFDEGHKPSDWCAGLEKRGINVHLDLLRQEAADVIHQYASEGGSIY
ncbi:MAG: nucleoside deaminase [Anaerohalosphaeraceae bacterium]